MHKVLRNDNDSAKFTLRTATVCHAQTLIAAFRLRVRSTFAYPFLASARCLHPGPRSGLACWSPGPWPGPDLQAEAARRRLRADTKSCETDGYLSSCETQMDIYLSLMKRTFVFFLFFGVYMMCGDSTTAKERRPATL